MPRKTVLLYADGDFEQLAELRMQVGIAERREFAAKSEPRRFGDEDTTGAEKEAAEKAYDEFVDEAAERAEEWVLESIGHEVWRKLLLEHPPRKVTVGEGEAATEVDHPEDQGWGVNTESFGKTLLLFVDPEDGDHRTVHKSGNVEISGLGKRLRRLSAGQFDHLWITAYVLNTGGVGDPKAERFSPGAPRSNET